MATTAWHRLRAPDTEGGMTVDRRAERRRSAVEGGEGEKDIANSSLKFKRKCQPIDQLRNFYQSQSTMLSFLVSSLLVVLLINGHITPAGSAAISVVTNDPTPTPPSVTPVLVTNRSDGGGSGSRSTPTAKTSTTAARTGDPGTIPSPIIRLPSNSLIKYTAYRDVSILHFQVPRDTRTLYYSFRAHEEFKSAFCE